MHFSPLLIWISCACNSKKSRDNKNPTHNSQILSPFSGIGSRISGTSSETGGFGIAGFSTKGVSGTVEWTNKSRKARPIKRIDTATFTSKWLCLWSDHSLQFNPMFFTIYLDSDPPLSPPLFLSEAEMALQLLALVGSSISIARYRCTMTKIRDCYWK